MEKVCKGYVFTRVCQSFCSQGVVSKHALQMVCRDALQVSRGWYPSMPCRSPGSHPEGKLRGLAGRGGLQAHTQGRSSGIWPGEVSRPTPRRKLKGLAWGVSRPTPGGVSRPTPGGCLQVHTQGGCLQAHTKGELGVSQHALRQTPPPQQMATAAGGTHPTGMHSCLQ